MNLQIGAPLNSEITPRLQWVEVASTFQIPGFQIIGLPGPEVAEAKERVKAAITASGFQFPKRRVVLNLSPASIRKQGTGIDLAMALAILVSTKKTSPRGPPLKCIAWGELGLNGMIKSSGQIMRTLYASLEAGVDLIFIPKEDEALAAGKAHILQKWGGNSTRPQILTVSTLQEAWQKLESLSEGRAVPNAETLTLENSATKPGASAPHLLPLTPAVERTLGISAAGSHHVLLLGPKGTGKSHAFEWLIAIQPPSSSEARLTQTLLREMNELESPSEGSNTSSGIFRRVGSQARPAALMGSAAQSGIRPGEYSLAHGGLLIADEFPEWARDTRESLREPLERGVITLSRTKGSVELPARFTLAANGNLCPCGGQSDCPSQDKKLRCRCLPMRKLEYLARISGPILDRIDLVFRTNWQHPSAGAQASSSLQQVRTKVQETRRRLIDQWGQPSGLLEASEIEKLLSDHPTWKKYLERTRTESLRSRHKILKITLTIAAWENEAVSLAHFLEAATYRSDRYF